MAELSAQVTIVNELGLHARAASKLVQLASKFPVELKIGNDEMSVNAKSIMGVLMLAACRGTDLTLTAVGDEQPARAAIDAVVQLIGNRFGEER